MKFTETFLPSKSNLSRCKRAFSASLRVASSTVAVSLDRFTRSSISTTTFFTSPYTPNISSKCAAFTFLVKFETCRNAGLGLSSFDFSSSLSGFGFCGSVDEDLSAGSSFTLSGWLPASEDSLLAGLVEVSSSDTDLSTSLALSCSTGLVPSFALSDDMIKQAPQLVTSPDDNRVKERQVFLSKVLEGTPEKYCFHIQPIGRPSFQHTMTNQRPQLEHTN